MKAEKLLLSNIKKILSLITAAEEYELYYAMVEKANTRLQELAKELLKLRSVYPGQEKEDNKSKLPLEAKLEDQIKEFKENSDGSKWASSKNFPDLTKYVKEKGGKAKIGCYTVYLTKSGYLKAYRRGEKNG